MHLPHLTPLIASLFLTGCLDEDEVCTTHDGLACDEAMTTIAELESTIAGLESRLAALEGEAVTSEDMGDVVRLLTEDPGYGTIEDVADLLQVLDDLDGYRIARDVTVTLSLASNTFEFDEALRLAHPDGHRIHIEGAGTGNTFLQFDDSDGVIIEGASALGLLTDLSISGGSSDEYSGLTVRESSSVGIGDLSVEGFVGAGVLVHGNADLQLGEDALLEVSACGNGILVSESGHANIGGTPDLPGAQVMDCEFDGISANGGTIEADEAVATGNDYANFTAENGGVLLADSATAEGPGSYGFFAYTGGFIRAIDAEAKGLTNMGFYASGASYIDAQRTVTEEVGTGYGAYYGSIMNASYSSISDATLGYQNQHNSLLVGITVIVDEKTVTTTAESSKHETDYMYGLAGE